MGFDRLEPDPTLAVFERDERIDQALQLHIVEGTQQFPVTDETRELIESLCQQSAVARFPLRQVVSAQCFDILATPQCEYTLYAVRQLRHHGATVEVVPQIGFAAPLVHRVVQLGETARNRLHSTLVQQRQ